MRFLEEKKRGSPERERERGKSVARTAPPQVAAAQVAAAPLQAVAASPAMMDIGEESSDNEDTDAIRVQEFKVKMETEKLARLRAKYAVKKELLRRKR